MSQTTTASTGFIQTIATDAANAFGVPVNLFLDQINAESGFNPNAVNPTPVQTASGPENAEGIAQFLPSTAQSLNVNPMDPVSALFGAAQYDSQLQQSTGSWLGALEAYGTLPQNPGTATLNSAQQTLYNAANSLGGSTVSGSSTGPTASIQNVTGLESNLINGLAGTSIPDAPAGTPTTSGGCSGISAIFTYSCWQSLVGNAVLIGVGGLLLLGAIMVIGKGAMSSTPVQIVTTGTKTAKRAFA